MPFPAAALKTKLQLLKSRLIVRPSYFREALLCDYTCQSIDELWVIVEEMSDERVLKTYLSSRETTSKRKQERLQSEPRMA
jgi:hypothetical protein